MRVREEDGQSRLRVELDFIDLQHANSAAKCAAAFFRHYLFAISHVQWLG